MHNLLTEIVVHLSQSHQQMARILDAKRHVTVRMAQLVQILPDEQLPEEGLEGLLEGASDVTKSIIAYVNSLAELEEAVADSLTHVVKASGINADEE